MSMKKSAYNIFFGILGQVATIAIGLLLPRLRIVSFGSEINGMVASVQQVYTYLSLLEAGVGGATMQALYGPIARGNQNEINGILSAANHYYKKTGIIYLAAVLAFAVIYPAVVKTDISKSVIVAVILFNGTGNVLSYFYQGKYRILLQAEGKQYILTNLSTFVSVFSGIAKVILIYFGRDIVTLQIAYFVFNLIQIVFFAYYIKRHYKWIDLKAKPNHKAIAQKNSALIHQITDMIFRNTDALILTMFCNLKVVSVYALYNMIYDMISTLINNINTGFSYKLGQLYNSDMRRFNMLFAIYERYYMAVSTGFYCVTFLLTKPFIALYTRGVSDIDYMMPYLPLLFVIVKLLVTERSLCGCVMSYAGHFKQTQNRAVTEAVINLTVSVVCVKFWGIYGVLIGTIVALLYRANDMILYANTVLMKRSPWQTYKWMLLDLGIMAGIVAIVRHLNIEVNSYPVFFICAAISTIIIMTVFLCATLILSYRKTQPYLVRIKKMVMNKIRRW